MIKAKKKKHTKYSKTTKENIDERLVNIRFRKSVEILYNIEGNY